MALHLRIVRQELRPSSTDAYVCHTSLVHSSYADLPLAIEHDVVTAHNGPNAGGRRPARPTALMLSNELARCRRVLREAQLEISMLQQQLAQAEVDKTNAVEAERAKFEPERVESANTIKSLRRLLRLCKEQGRDVMSQEVLSQIDEDCPPLLRQPSHEASRLPIGLAPHQQYSDNALQYSASPNQPNKASLQQYDSQHQLHDVAQTTRVPAQTAVHSAAASNQTSQRLQARQDYPATPSSSHAGLARRDHFAESHSDPLPLMDMDTNAQAGSAKCAAPSMPSPTATHDLTTTNTFDNASWVNMLNSDVMDYTNFNFDVEDGTNGDGSGNL